MLSRAVVLATEGEHELVNELPFDSFYFGVIAFVALISVLLLTYSFRSVGSRHPDRDGLQDGTNPDHGGAQGGSHAAPRDTGSRH